MRRGSRGSTVIALMAPESRSPIRRQCLPPSPLRYRPVPSYVMLAPPGLGSPVPAYRAPSGPVRPRPWPGSSCRARRRRRCGPRPCCARSRRWPRRRTGCRPAAGPGRATRSARRCSWGRPPSTARPWWAVRVPGRRRSRARAGGSAHPARSSGGSGTRPVRRGRGRGGTRHPAPAAPRPPCGRQEGDAHEWGEDQMKQASAHGHPLLRHGQDKPCRRYERGGGNRRARVGLCDGGGSLSRGHGGGAGLLSRAPSTLGPSSPDAGGTAGGGTAGGGTRRRRRPRRGRARGGRDSWGPGRPRDAWPDFAPPTGTPGPLGAPAQPGSAPVTS